MCGSLPETRRAGRVSWLEARGPPRGAEPGVRSYIGLSISVHDLVGVWGDPSSPRLHSLMHFFLGIVEQLLEVPLLKLP